MYSIHDKPRVLYGVMINELVLMMFPLPVSSRPGTLTVLTHY